MDTTFIDEQVEELDITIEQAKKIIDDADSLINLSKNPDFKRIIVEGYFVNEASRLVLAKATPSMATEALQKDIENSIIAIGHLQRHFNSIIAMGNMARKSLSESEDTREELLRESA